MNNINLEKIKYCWFNLPQGIRFVIIGCFNAGVSYFIYAIFCFLFGSSVYQLALLTAWVVSSFISFNAQKYLVFQSFGNWLREYLKCCMTWILSYILNALLLELCVKTLTLNVYIAQFVSTLSVAVLTFVLFKNFAFKGKVKEKN